MAVPNFLESGHFVDTVFTLGCFMQVFHINLLTLYRLAFTENLSMLLYYYPLVNYSGVSNFVPVLL
jgi:hypothetical protein